MSPIEMIHGNRQPIETIIHLGANGGGEAEAHQDARASNLNMALGKKALQSTYSDWSTLDESQTAVSGLKTGKFAFHTAFEDRPWWQVDLGEITVINKIVIYNRLDACSERAYALEVLAGNLLCEMTVIHSQGGRAFGGLGGQPLVVDLRKNARFVRVQLPTSGALHLDQVEIFGPR